MRKTGFILILFIVVFCNGRGQQLYKLSSESADCTGMIDLIMPRDTVFGPTTAPLGPGNVMEITGEATSLYAFEQEHHTVWYRFRVPQECTLTFEIIPVSVNDDYDFLLYRYTGKDFCKEVQNKTLKPVRTCISRNDIANGSRTGLKISAPEEFIHSGPGSSYCSAIDAKKGDIFVLVVDNVYPKGSGHTIKFRFGPPRVTAVNETEKVIKEPEKSSLSVNIVDKETGALITATARVYSKQKSLTVPVVVFDSVTSFNTGLEPNQTYFIKIEKEDYFDFYKEFKTTDKAEKLTLRAELEKIIVGKNYIFDNILFYGNEARFLPESIPVLESILNTMKKNPNLKIEIQGHVNCPTTWDDCNNKKFVETNMKLSIDRAKAVFDYLTENHIDPSRMTYKGFGATKMLYPDARSEDKQKKNRRVEIIVISNEP